MPCVWVDGKRVQYHVAGKGIPIVFIPPPVVGSAVFRNQVRGLANEFMLILLELRGHGQSQSCGELTYPLIAKDIQYILDDLNINQAFITGYSMGGSAVLEFVRRYPDRVVGAIPISGFSEVSDVRFRTEISTAVGLAGLRAQKTLAFALSLANADSLSSLQLMYRLGRTCDMHDVQSMFQYALEYNCTHNLAELSVPMRLFFGARDRRLFHYIKLFREELPNKEIVMVPASRHQIPLKHAQTLNDNIREFVSMFS